MFDICMSRVEKVACIIEAYEPIERLVQLSLEIAGFRSVGLNFKRVQEDPQSYCELIQEHNPSVLVFGVPYPFLDSLAVVKGLIGLDISKGRTFVLHSGDRTGVDKYRDSGGGLDILDDPFDLEDLISAANRPFRLKPHDELSA